MHIASDRLVFSPSDLNQFLECEHLTQLERTRDRQVPLGQRDPHAELLALKGAEHEAARLERFRAEGRQVITIGAGQAPRDWPREAASTSDAMRSGVDVIYQGVFVDESWQGVSDFLVRVDVPSALGRWSYEAWDTKLARHSRPYFVLQLCFYTEQLRRLQARTPEWMTIVLGTGREERLRYCDFDAYYRAVRRRFLAAAGGGGTTYPYPVSHCALCEHDAECRAQRRADDHLSEVAGIRRRQVERLNQAGVRTLAELARVDPSRHVGIGVPALERLRHQASLQDSYRQSGRHRFELLPGDERSGFRLLPKPSPGDIFFDIEGDPYFEPGRGLEYLFGVVTTSGGDRLPLPVYRAFWAQTKVEEKTAFEQLVDFLHERLREFPDLHVYHYAPYETAALKRLMSEHATREDAIDDLLRREVFVDLYQVVRQTVRVSHNSYSIKKIRTFFMEGAGRGTVADGGDSILQFERWRTSGDAALLEAIERYNEEDCISTIGLRDWLLDLRHEAEGSAGAEIPWRLPITLEPKPERVAEDEATRVRREALLARARRVSADREPAGLLLADLLNYHRREAKPEYWSYFERRKKSLEDLMDDTLAIARLEADEAAPVPLARSVVHSLRFPPQEFKLAADPKAQVEDPFGQRPAGTIESLDAQRGIIGLKRGPSRSGDPLPVAIIAGPPVDTKPQRMALARVGDSWLEPGARYQAIRDMLERKPPRFRGRAEGKDLQTTDLAAQQQLVATLDDSYLVIQGPPGSGKTWLGARLIVSLIRSGARVGVAANTHKAINNLLEEVERVAVAERVLLTGLKKGTGADALGGRMIRDSDSNEECETSDVQLIAGTSWLFSRPLMDGRVDYLFMDEAGQVALADAVAMATAARNVVLLGDPQQLPQVRQGVHPGRSGCSVLEHLLDGHDTIAADRGLFLERSWRMHPAVCSFVSELSYAGRLTSAEDCRHQRIDSPGLRGSGLRFLPVAHDGNTQQSVEEARAIADAIDQLLRGAFTDHRGVRRPLRPADILVVAPYNMQVRALVERLPAGVAIGTVDRFQGREAPVVFFSMASSRGEDVPRGLEFLYSRNRFNVAVSRARAMAVVVCSPSLLETRCTSVEQLRLVNALCRFAERAVDEAGDGSNQSPVH